MGTYSKQENLPNKEKWEKLSRKTNLSPEFRHQVLRNLALATHGGSVIKAATQVVNSMVPFQDIIPPKKPGILNHIPVAVRRLFSFLKGR